MGRGTTAQCAIPTDGGGFTRGRDLAAAPAERNCMGILAGHSRLHCAPHGGR